METFEPTATENAAIDAFNTENEDSGLVIRVARKASQFTLRDASGALLDRGADLFDLIARADEFALRHAARIERQEVTLRHAERVAIPHDIAA